MNWQSKYFTPPLTIEDRKRLYKCFGFSNLKLFYAEAMGQNILRFIKFQGLEKESLLQPVSIAELKANFFNKQDPVILYQHLQDRSHLNEYPVNTPTTLWESLFPFPLNLLAQAFSMSSKFIQFYPTEIFNSLRALSDTFQKLEIQMLKTELSCLWVKGLEDEMPVLFHYVRRKCIRVGTSPKLEGLGKRFIQNELNSDTLRDFFGTQTSFFYLESKTEKIKTDGIVENFRLLVNQIEPGFSPGIADI